MKWMRRTGDKERDEIRTGNKERDEIRTGNKERDEKDREQ